MNDFWNDPPETPEQPFCEPCDEYMTIAENGLSAKCPICGKEWKAEIQEIPDPADIELPNDYLKSN